MLPRFFLVCSLKCCNRYYKGVTKSTKMYTSGRQITSCCSFKTHLLIDLSGSVAAILGRRYNRCVATDSAVAFVKRKFSVVHWQQISLYPNIINSRLQLSKRKQVSSTDAPGSRWTLGSVTILTEACNYIFMVGHQQHFVGK